MAGWRGGRNQPGAASAMAANRKRNINQRLGVSGGEENGGSKAKK